MMVHLQSTLLSPPKILHLSENVGIWFCALLRPLQHPITYQLPPRGCTHLLAARPFPIIAHTPSGLNSTHDHLQGLEGDLADGDMGAENQSGTPRSFLTPCLHISSCSGAGATFLTPTNWVPARLLDLPRDRREKSLMRLEHGPCASDSPMSGHFILFWVGVCQAEPETRILTQVDDIGGNPRTHQ